MTPLLLSGPAVEPLSLAEAKSWLKLDSADEDQLVQSLITAARLAVEARTNRLLITQQWRLMMDAWPAEPSLSMPLAPVRSIVRLTTLDANGVGADVPPTLYGLDGNLDHARLVLGSPLPSPGQPVSGIWLDVTGGYGDASAIPEPLRLAMRQLIALWFGDRGDGGGRVPGFVLALLAPYRVRRLA